MRCKKVFGWYELEYDSGGRFRISRMTNVNPLSRHVDWPSSAFHFWLTKQFAIPLRPLQFHLLVDESVVPHHPTTPWRPRGPSLAVSSSFQYTIKAVCVRTQPQQHTDCDHKEIHLDNHLSYHPHRERFTLHAPTMKTDHHHRILKMQEAHHNPSHLPHNNQEHNSPPYPPPTPTATATELVSPP